MINTYENVLSMKESENLYNTITDNHNFPWYFNKGSTDRKDGRQQYTHLLTDYTLIVPLLDFLKKKEKLTGIMRARLVSKPKQSTHYEYVPHTDIPDYNEPYRTAVYYINKTNGGTKVKNVIHKGIQNSMTVFDGNVKHSAIAQTDVDFRFVCNINFITT